MNKNRCTIDPCTNPQYNRGWCSKHYSRWRRHGDVHATSHSYGMSLSERLWLRVDKAGPVPAHDPSLGRCWIWTRGTDRYGYGKLRANGRSVLAHRLSFELEHGSAPPIVDHRCYTPRCVRPSHLRPATQAENLANRNGAQTNSKTGVRGVSIARSGRYVARIGVAGKTVYLGTFDTLEEAASAAQVARDDAFKEFAGR